MEFYTTDFRLFNRGQTLCLGMNVHVPYEGRSIPFYLECRAHRGDDGGYYAEPDEKTLSYISDEGIRNQVRETAKSDGTLYLNTERDDFSSY